MADDFVVDMDSARAARREAQKQQPQVVFGGRTYVLPFELPLEASLRLAEREGDERSSAKAIMAVIEVLLGDQVEAFMSTPEFSGDDLEAFLEGVLPLYGVGDTGESKASGSSSSSTSRTLRQISNGPMASTSAPAASGPQP